MSNDDKTHFRKAFNSPYLSSADIVGPTILTISRCVLEKDHTKKTGDLFNTLYFVEKEIRRGEKLKPMIANSTNSKFLAKLTGSPFIDDWKNIQVTVYVDSNVKMMGEIVDGLRLKEVAEKPKIKKGTKQWNNAIAACKRDGNLEAIKKRVDVSAAQEREIMKAAGVQS